MREFQIIEQIKREVDKQNFNFGVQNHDSIGHTTVHKDNVVGFTKVSIAFGITEVKKWDEIIIQPLLSALGAHNDYERRPELIKASATLINWIDCIDRNGRAVPPPLTVEEFTDNDLMPFGMYKGFKLSLVPAEHLLMALENNFVDGALRDYIVKNKTALHERTASSEIE
jgi:hypothetical protein